MIHPFILICIVICSAVLLWILFKGEIADFLMRAVLGGAIIYAVNLILPQFAIGINPLTVCYSGVLGVPGVVMLYIVNYIL